MDLANWFKNRRDDGPLRDGLAAVKIKQTVYRDRYMLKGRWSIQAERSVARFRASARHDPMFDSIRLTCAGRGDWIRLIYDLTPEMHQGGPFTVSFDLGLPDEASEGLAWSAFAYEGDFGEIVIGQKFYTRMSKAGVKNVRLDTTQLPPGRSCWFVFNLTSFPSTIEVGSVKVTLHEADTSSPPPPPPPPEAIGVAVQAAAMTRGLRDLSPSSVAQKMWSGDDGFRKLRETFWEQYYIAVAGLDASTSVPDAFLHFVEHGLRAGLLPNPMFNEAYYREQVAVHGLPPIESGKSPFLHWLGLGGPAGVIPTLLFDEDEYRYVSKVSVPRGLYFAHYLRLGFRRDFAPSQYFDARWYAAFYKIPDGWPAIIDYALTGEAEGRSPHPWIAATPPEADGASLGVERVADAMHKHIARLNSPALKALVEKAAAIEPRIMRPSDRRIVTSAPLKHGAARLWAAGVRMRKTLKATRYDSLVFTPHCRMAGSARVAGSLVEALDRLDPSSSTLLVTTELADFERPDWFPDNVEILNLPELLGPRRIDLTELLLLDLAQGLRPGRIFNVNSLAGWKFLARFGRQLRLRSELYSYVFTWEIDRLGVKCGYPIVELQQCLDSLDTCFVDNAALARELGWRYSMPDDVAARKLSVLWSPTDLVDLDLSGNFAARRAAKAPMACLWAGRFDRQKRLDIAVQAAERRRNLAFSVYGKPVLADDSDMPKTFPPNVALKGVYQDLSDVGLEHHDFFFYTSAWDGVPTVLLDMGARGVPVLASACGGVGDLIDEQTGWPVADWQNPDAYLARIDEMTADPAEVTARARRLRARIAERHSNARFDRDLSAVLTRQAFAREAAE